MPPTIIDDSQRKAAKAAGWSCLATLVIVVYVNFAIFGLQWECPSPLVHLPIRSSVRSSRGKGPSSICFSEERTPTWARTLQSGWL
jgi:hypothetical protein